MSLHPMCTLYYAVTIQVVIIKKSRISQSNKAKQSARDADLMFLALINTTAVQPVATCRQSPNVHKSQIPLRYLVVDRSEAGRRPAAN